MAALAGAEAEDMEFLQSPEARTHDDFDKDVAKEVPEILEALGGLQEAWKTLSPSPPLDPPRPFTLIHHDLSFSNVLVDPSTHKITGMVDWECTGTRPDWEHRYPMFLKFDGCYEIEEEPEPLSPGDEDAARVGRRQDWESTKLRPSWDEELRNTNCGDDAVDEMKLEWRSQLDWLEVWPERVLGWTNAVFKEWSSGPQVPGQCL